MTPEAIALLSLIVKGTTLYGVPAFRKIWTACHAPEATIEQWNEAFDAAAKLDEEKAVEAARARATV